MSVRTLIASPEGIERAKKALKAKNLTQMLFSEEVQLGYTTVSNFFNRKAIYRTNFQEICVFLGLEWQDIAALDEEETELSPLGILWQQLINLGSSTEQMGLLLVKEETLGWGKKKSSPYKKSVPVGSNIVFEINFETPGYLLLLQKDTSGEVWCYCPSCFASQSRLDDGKTSLPQEDSPIASFPIEGEPGEEQVVAVITPEILAFDWFPQGSDDPLQLEESHLSELMDYLQTSDGFHVFYTDYTII